jgi:ubiquinone/menaquinone biosynthesis C-methylase UbiE
MGALGSGAREEIMNEAPLDRTVTAHYERSFDEAERLTATALGRLEWMRTWAILTRYLPPPPSEILDVGGGSGAYAFALARQGHSVRLLDAVARHVEQAQLFQREQQPDRPLTDVSLGDARALPYEDDSADVVLLLGPLYHLIRRDDRIQALTEARRVLRANGVVIVAAISRFASLLDGLARGFLKDPQFERIVETDLKDGVHRNPTGGPEWFTTAYFHHPYELAEEVAYAGLEPGPPRAVEGPGWAAPDLEDLLEDRHRTHKLLEYLSVVETEPSLLGASPHLLITAHKVDRQP